MPQLVAFPTDGIKYRGVKEFAQRARANLEIAHDAIIEARVRATYQANLSRSEEKPFGVGDLAYLSTANLNLPKQRARKLAPKYIGPYKVTEAYPEMSDYVLELTPELVARRIHPRFHVSLLRAHEPNDDALFPSRESNFLKVLFFSWLLLNAVFFLGDAMTTFQYPPWSSPCSELKSLEKKKT
jgi:hypothetical protein